MRKKQPIVSGSKVLSELGTRFERIFKNLEEGFGSITVAIERLTPVLRRLAGTIAPGTEAGDILAVLSTVRPEDERLKAAKRIARRLGRVIHHTRWSWVQPELMRLARLHNQTPEKELEDKIVSCLFQAADVGGTYTPNEVLTAHKAIRTRLSELLTTDLLGPGWRRKTGASRIQEVPIWEISGPTLGRGSIAYIETKLSVELLISRAHLTKREAEVIRAYLLEGSIVSAAKRLAKNPSTAGVLYGRALKKIQSRA